MADNTKIRAVFFDFTGTCLDRHSGTIKALPPIHRRKRAVRARTWRGATTTSTPTPPVPPTSPPKTINVPLRTALERPAGEASGTHARKHAFDDRTKRNCVAAWALDAGPAEQSLLRIEQLNGRGALGCPSSANGTAAVPQLDLCGILRLGPLT